MSPPPVAGCACTSSRGWFESLQKLLSFYQKARPAPAYGQPRVPSKAPKKKTLMLLHPLPTDLGGVVAGAAAGRSGGDRFRTPPRRRRRLLLPARADSSPPSRSISAAPPAKPAICTADELHYAPVPGAGWRLSLWRYAPPPQAPARNHPLMLLSGVGTNAIGFDLSPGASFARHMSSQGFDTWIVEVRGAGLSMRDSYGSATPGSGACEDISSSIVPLDKQTTLEAGPLQNTGSSAIDGKEHEIFALDEPWLVTEVTATFMRVAEAMSKETHLRTISANFFDQISKLLEDARLNEKFYEIAEKISGLFEMEQSAAIAGPMRDLSQGLVKIIQEGQQFVSAQNFLAIFKDFQKQMHLSLEYNWDFDHYLEEDIPSAMEYIRLHSKAKDGKLLAIGHSMGGILLYAMLSKSGFQGVPARLAAIVTLASSVDYTTSNSSLKLLLPLASPAQSMNFPPVVPLGSLLAAAYPFASRPPYVLSWLNSQISAQDMMHPELLSKLVFNNFCTVPAKVVLQLTTAFKEGGLRNRTGTFSYKDHLQQCRVPVLALAGDEDLICPPEAVYETVKLIPQHMVNYKVFGKPEGPHYAHYDLVGGRLSVNEVYPCIIEFLSRHDGLSP